MLIFLLIVICVVLFIICKNQKSKLKTSQKEIADYKNLLETSGFNDYQKAQENLDEMNKELERVAHEITDLKNEAVLLDKSNRSVESKIKAETNKLNKLSEKIRAIDYAAGKYEFSDIVNLKIQQVIHDLDEFVPSVMLKLHSFDIKELNKAFKENDKRITDLADSYRSRYTTKANHTIYELMVIALRAELQNILYDLKYQKLEDGMSKVKEITAKYQSIACEGNQSIAPTITKFISELEYFFTNAVKIEYEYYVKKEQARQEQIAIRERMKQEAEERKALEAEKKRVEAEEAKYQKQIEDIQAKIESSDDTELEALRKRLLDLEAKLSDVAVKKDEIVNLQNGKAGNVYIISNLGSFGENVFKIGMTRRLNPQERVDELGDASVPFSFDVHSFIFSEDAVSLENELHQRLNEKRVNKVNPRKEFFKSSVEELEALTHEISPTAEFIRTMAAEEFRQSLSEDNDIA